MNRITKTNETQKIAKKTQELEEVILGAILLDKNVMPNICGSLPKKAFINENNAEIYGAVLDLFMDGDAIDMITVTQKLRANGTLEKVGGAFYISQITSKVNSSANIEYHTKILLQYYMKSKMKLLLGEYYDKIYNENVDSVESLQEITSKLINLSNDVFTEDVNTEKHTIEMLKMLDDAINSKGNTSGLTTGFRDLDRHTNGWQKTDLVYIAGRPAMGKTAFLLSMINEEIKQDKTILFFSLEMGGGQLIQRLTSIESQIELHKIRRGALDEEEIEIVKRTANDYGKTKMFICDIAGMNLLQIRSVCNKIHHTNPIDVIYIDYLQLMTGVGQSREQEVGNNSRGLKAIAKEFNTPVICLSQLSRQVESRPNKRPMLSDLRDSGSLEQDADQVYFLYRPEYYGEELVPVDATGQPMPEGFTELINAKNRNGETKSIFIKFDKNYTKFIDFENIEIS